MGFREGFQIGAGVKKPKKKKKRKAVLSQTEILQLKAIARGDQNR